MAVLLVNLIIQGYTKSVKRQYHKILRMQGIDLIIVI